FFPDAAALFGMDCEAREVAVPPWAYDTSRYVEPPPQAKVKKPKP
ncbi:MAG: hypothetical protein RL385_5236, partial [Pseudomonadota bacterium]